jgi:hypothetical protein
MKKLHILLILLIAGIAAFFLNELRSLKGRESIAQVELTLLRDAVKKFPGGAASSTLSGRSSTARPAGIDPKAFVADLTDILKSGSNAGTEERLKELARQYESKLNSAPVSKLKELCELLEKDFPLDQEGLEMARKIWLGVLGMASKSDPSWAITKFEQAAAANKIPTEAMLGTLGRWATQNGEALSLSYAAALQKWLDAAQTEGTIEPNHPLVAKLRSQIATAQGNQSAAVQQLSKLPYLNQQQAAMDYATSLQTPDAQRLAMEELSEALHIQNFPHFVRKLTDQQGYDAARQILDSASLAPEKHDLAAASIAATDIGAGTPAKAKWLLESLRSEDTRAIQEFTDQWTHADYKGAAQWLGSLPEGRQRDSAISSFASVAAKIDGASAVDWALTISDPAQRRSGLEAALQTWRESDPEAANSYLKGKESLQK